MGRTLSCNEAAARQWITEGSRCLDGVMDGQEESSSHGILAYLDSSNRAFHRAIRAKIERWKLRAGVHASLAEPRYSLSNYRCHEYCQHNPRPSDLVVRAHLCLKSLKISKIYLRENSTVTGVHDVNFAR